jgi:hypothetical protein
MTIGTMFTRFVLPACYQYLARAHAHDAGSAAGPQDEARPPPEPQHG